MAQCYRLVGATFRHDRPYPHNATGIYADVELIGPSSASMFTYLIPALGAIFAVIILGEPFPPYHAVALVLGLSGVYLAEIRSKLMKPRMA